MAQWLKEDLIIFCVIGVPMGLLALERYRLLKAQWRLLQTVRETANEVLAELGAKGSPKLFKLLCAPGFDWKTVLLANGLIHGSVMKFARGSMLDEHGDIRAAKLELLKEYRRTLWIAGYLFVVIVGAMSYSMFS